MRYSLRDYDYVVLRTLQVRKLLKWMCSDLSNGVFLQFLGFCFWVLGFWVLFSGLNNILIKEREKTRTTFCTPAQPANSKQPQAGGRRTTSLTPKVCEKQHTKKTNTQKTKRTYKKQNEHIKKKPQPPPPPPPTPPSLKK